MSKWARRHEAERFRSRSVLRQRKQAQLCHTNPRSSTRSAACRNQSSFEMGFVGMEQNCLHHGLSAGQRRHRGDSSRQKEETKVTQRPLEENFNSIARQRLGEPQVEKVKAHQSKKQRDEETLKQASARERNEEADKRAVEAAARNAAPSQLAEKRKKVVKIEKLIQTMMLQIMEKRGQMMKTWGHSSNNDAAAFRILEAGRSDDNLRQLIEKESERK